MCLPNNYYYMFSNVTQLYNHLTKSIICFTIHMNTQSYNMITNFYTKQRNKQD